MSVKAFCICSLFAVVLSLSHCYGATNLLTNPGFESGTTGWSGLGCSITTSTTVYRSGSRSGYAYSRTATWNGLLQSLLGKMEAGKTYTISGWMMLENAGSNGDLIKATIKKTDGGVTTYTCVCQTTGYNGVWTPLIGTYTHSVNGTLTALDLYFEGPASGVNYYLDDANVVLYELPTPEPNATGKVDFGDVHQELEGFGASGAWYENWITPGMPEPNRSNLYDTLFRDSGFDIYRVRNSYGYDSNYITRTKEIVQAAKTRNPSLKVLNSAWSPPAYLKSNNDINSYPQPGTLKKDANGVYMYDEYANWWAASLAAFESNNIHLDYVSIQNEPDYEATYDSCKFLPTQDSNYAGYDQALEHVYQKFNSVMGPNMPKLLSPDGGGIGVSQPYINALVDANHVYGYAHHLYMDGDYNYPDNFIPGMQSFARNYGYKPLLQTEYGKLDGQRTDFNVAMNTARHIHNSLVYEGVRAYLYWDLFWGPDSGLVSFTTYGGRDYTINPIYYAFKHYSYFTDPNWYRVEASTDSNGLRIAAFKNPGDSNLTVVVLNVSPTVDVNLSLSLVDFNATSSAVYRTKSDANFAYIGTFNQSQPLLLPKNSITTISMGGIGWSWKPLSSGMDSWIYALTIYNGELIAGGSFTTAGGVDANYIARWDGSNWHPLGSGTNGEVDALTVYNGQLIAGGKFTSAGGVDANNIARWDGSNWRSLGSGTGSEVYALTVYKGKLIAGGAFFAAGGVDANRIARWNGTNWQPLGGGMNNPVFALTVYNGQLIAGGTFVTAGGIDAKRVACWNDPNWQPLDGGMTDSGVLALTDYNDLLIAGGLFQTVDGGVTANRIARWNGTNWQPLGSGMNTTVYALTVYNGELIAGGYFTTAGGVNANYIARWNGSNWRPLGSGTNDYIRALMVYSGELIAGGLFTTAGGLPANRIARWGLPVIYKGDLNHDSVVDMLDMDWFSEHWLESDCFATGWCYEADLNYDFTVNFEDFALLAKQWLEKP